MTEAIQASNPFEKRFLRERNARKQAEKLLENKSLELYQSNLELQKLAEDLEQKVAERTAELEKERNKALALSKAKSEFVATMSHEIRTPINGVIGALKLLESETLTEECHHLVSIAHHSSELLLQIINDILDFSKIDAGQMQIECVPINLAVKLRHMTETFKPVCQQKNLTFSTQIAPDVSEWIATDPLRLSQVLNNFISNAIKFTETGSVTLKVLLQDTQIVFEVIDTGIGISEAGQQKLFQDFSQVDASTSRRFGGTGLGLVITKKLIELMGGAVGVRSQPGQGSCFWASLPYQMAEPLNLPNEKQSSKFEVASKAQILLVDDNLINRQIGSRILEKFGHTVVCVDSGFEAIKIVQSQTFDLIFMDCQMPEMDGFETTRRLRHMNNKTPTIALTANTSEEDRKAAFESGMNDFMTKPFEPNKIQKIIQVWLDQAL